MLFGRWIKGTVLGGGILFVWSMITWMVLPFHAASLLRLGDEDAIIQSVLAGAPQSGMYLAPHPHEDQSGNEAEPKMLSGPMVLAAVRREPAAGMGVLMGRQFLIYVAGAGLATALVLAARPMRYGRRVLFIVGIALAIAVIGHLPAWNWWSFSTAYTLTEVGDIMIGWTLAGLAIAWVAAPPRGAA